VDLNMQKKVAENIKQLRNVFGYTQAEIADELHICRSTYTLYESGKKLPNTDTLVDLASFYDIRLDVLVDADTNKHIRQIFSQKRCMTEIAQLIKTYYQLSPHAQGKLIERAEILLETEAAGGSTANSR